MIGDRSKAIFPIVILALYVSHSVLQAQTQDSTRDDMGLDPEGFKFDNDLISHYSHGWFPQTFPAHSLSIFTDFLYSDTFDQAVSIRSRAFHPTTSSFNNSNPFLSGERAIMQAGQSKEEDDGYPVSN